MKRYRFVSVLETVHNDANISHRVVGIGLFQLHVNTIIETQRKINIYNYEVFLVVLQYSRVHPEIEHTFTIIVDIVLAIRPFLLHVSQHESDCLSLEWNGGRIVVARVGKVLAHRPDIKVVQVVNVLGDPRPGSHKHVHEGPLGAPVYNTTWIDSDCCSIVW
jgi:hypothetical protein